MYYAVVNMGIAAVAQLILQGISVAICAGELVHNFYTWDQMTREIETFEFFTIG